ncbi:MAG: hypothetical protein IJA20_02705 [Methanocorpusculum sp.]|nr:hypothetical protein [Methanocorpusculum sp.]
MEIDIYMTLENGQRITIRDIIKLAVEHQDELPEALTYLVSDISGIQITDIIVNYKGDKYPFPESYRYENKYLTDEQWDSLLLDMEYMQKVLDHTQMSIPRAYINICLYKQEVLSMEQFDAANGGNVPLTIGDLIDYAKDLADNGVIDIPEDLYPYINWAALGKSFVEGREMTDEDLHTNEQWFIN